MCDCIERHNPSLVRELQARLVLMTSLNGSRPPSVAIPTEWVANAKPKRGQRSPLLIASFCPFCGAAYERDAAEREGSDG